jgi:hypothetical protein
MKVEVKSRGNKAREVGGGQLYRGGALIARDFAPGKKKVSVKGALVDSELRNTGRKSHLVQAR